MMGVRKKSVAKKNRRNSVAGTTDRKSKAANVSRQTLKPPRPIQSAFARVVVEHVCDDWEGQRSLQVQLFYGVLLELGFDLVSDGDDYDDVMEDVRELACDIGDYGVEGQGHFLYINGTLQFASDSETIPLTVPPPGADWDERLVKFQRRVGTPADKGAWTLLIAEAVQ